MANTDVMLQNLYLDNTASGTFAGRSPLVIGLRNRHLKMEGCGLNIYDSDGPIFTQRAPSFRTV